MRRAWWLVVFGCACSAMQPAGTFRIPLQTGAQSVQLKTVLAAINGPDLELYDGATGTHFGEGKGELYTEGAVPYRFSVPAQYPLTLTMNAQYLQDSMTRPYKTLALAPLDLNASTLVRVTLSSGADQRVVVSSGGNLFTETAEAQPALTDLPGPLFALDSVSGAGLWLPSTLNSMLEWQDSMTTFAPADPTKPSFCGAPLVAKLTSASQVMVTVPAGSYQTTQVKEVIDACQQPNAAQVLVYEIDRWFAQGVGPVKMTYEGADLKTREYDLVSSQLQPSATGTWPLQTGNRWTYQVIGTDGKQAGAPIDVSVAAVITVSLPRQ